MHNKLCATTNSSTSSSREVRTVGIRERVNFLFAASFSVNRKKKKKKKKKLCGGIFF
jgi:hypothetical protein